MSEERLDELRSSTIGGAPVGYTGLSPLLYDPTHPLRILVADDTEASQVVICKLLERLGHTVRLANNGEEAVRLFENEPFDLVMMDIEMPVVNGFEAANRIRAIEATQQWAWTPIIFLTASDKFENLVTAIEAGGDDYIVKSAPQGVLQAKMKAMARIAMLRQRLRVLMSQAAT